MNYLRAVFCVFLLVLVSIIAYSVYLVRAFLPWIGYLALGTASLFLISGMAVALTFAARFFYDSKVIPVEAYGAYIQRFNKLTALPPLVAATPLQSRAKVVEQAGPSIPRLAEMILAGTLVREEESGLQMFQGFRQDRSIRYGEWPGVIAASGMQNVGKSVTITTLVIIALLQGAQVVVCDTHYKKPRSLYRKLESLAGFVEFAVTEQEVLQQTEKFSTELQNRKQGSPLFPYIFVMDETASIMRSDIAGEVTNAIEEASQEGHGYNLHMILAIHDFSQEGLGDARIRSFLNWIYCHRMEAGQAKFIAAFNSRKTKAAIAGLPRGHTIAKDECNEIEYLIMPLADHRDAQVARKKLLELRGPLPTPEIPRFTSESERFTRAESENFRRETDPLSIAAPRETDDFTTYTGRKRKIKLLRSLHYLQGEILQTVYRVQPGATEAYKLAVKEYKQIIAELATEETINV